MPHIFPWTLNYDCGGAEFPALFENWEDLLKLPDVEIGIIATLHDSLAQITLAAEVNNIAKNEQNTSFDLNFIDFTENNPFGDPE